MYGRLRRSSEIPYQLFQSCPTQGKFICTDTFQNSNKRWNHHVFNNEDVTRYIKQKMSYRFYNDTWLRLPLRVMRYDVWRYLVVYHEGGCYLDCDAGVVEKDGLTSLVEGSSLVLATENDVHIAQHFFCAAPRHPLLKQLLDKVKEKLVLRDYDVSAEHFVHATTGPWIFTETIADYFHVGNHRALDIYNWSLQHAETDVKIRSSSFMETNFVNFRCKKGYGWGNLSHWTQERDSLKKQPLEKGK